MPAEDAATAVVTAPNAPNAISAPVAGETFAQQMERFGGFTAGDGSPLAEDAAPSAPAPDAADSKVAKGKKGKAAASKAAKAAGAVVETAVAAAAPEVAAAAAPAVDKLAQLKTLAAELNLDVDDTRVSVRERVEFREAKAKLHRQIENQQAEVLRQLNEAKGQFSDELTFAQKIKLAKANNDYEGIAQLLGAKDWNGLQEDVIAQISDPNYKRLRELEQFKTQQEEQTERQRVENERRSFAQRQEQARGEHVQHLTAQMRNSKDPLVAAMHDDPLFINTVIEVQRQNWDGQTTVTPEKAIKIAAQGFQAPLETTMRTVYEKLHKVFGAQTAAVVAGATPQQLAQAAAVVSGPPTASGVARQPVPAARSTKNRTAVAPAAAVDAASTPAKLLTKKERDADFSRRLREAIAEDS